MENNDNKFQEAFRVLTEKFAHDPDYRRAWSANIAMAFYDEVRRDKVFASEGEDLSQLTHERLHKIANRAAEYFLNNLCMDTKKPEVEGSFSSVMDQTRRAQVSRDVQDERNKQEGKWGQQNHDPFKYMAILMEEVGEASQAAVEAFDWKTQTWRHEMLAHHREELVQVAAVAQAQVECLDRAMWEKK